MIFSKIHFCLYLAGLNLEIITPPNPHPPQVGYLFCIRVWAGQMILGYIHTYNVTDAPKAMVTLWEGPGESNHLRLLVLKNGSNVKTKLVKLGHIFKMYIWQINAFSIQKNRIQYNYKISYFLSWALSLLTSF